MAELMTLEELAEYLRFNKRTIYRLLKEEGVPAIKIGNKWRFDKAAIDNWLHEKIAGVKASILVVDDEPTVRSLFKEVLGKQGHAVVAVGTSAEGLQRVKEQDFDLVFLDLKMPGMDGAELFCQIRAIRPKLPVTIITAYPESDMMARALSQGPFGVMVKPFGPSEILSAVDVFLRTARK